LIHRQQEPGIAKDPATVAPNGAVFSFYYTFFLSSFPVSPFSGSTDMTDQHQPLQPVAALAQMMAEMAAMHREQAVINQQNLQQLHLQTARQTQVLEGLIFRSETADIAEGGDAAPDDGSG